MAHAAVAGEAVRALRRDIARIEGRPAETLDGGSQDMVLRRHGVAATADGPLPTGLERFDQALGGGLPRAALIELHGTQTRDAAVVSGFAAILAQLAMLAAPAGSPLLWVGTAEMFREAGLPYAAGLHERFGVPPERLLLAEAPKPVDALWIAEEAARVQAIGAVLVELRGHPSRLDLTATRRLHRRAQDAGHPVILVRHAAEDEPTAAPLRLRIAAAPAGERTTFDGPLVGSIGPPSFHIAITKTRNVPSADFVLEWIAHERRLQERPAAYSRALVPASFDRQDFSPATGPVVALRPGDAGLQQAVAAARAQPSRREHAADLRARRAG